MAPLEQGPERTWAPRGGGLKVVVGVGAGGEEEEARHGVTVLKEGLEESWDVPHSFRSRARCRRPRRRWCVGPLLLGRCLRQRWRQAQAAGGGFLEGLRCRHPLPLPPPPVRRKSNARLTVLGVARESATPDSRREQGEEGVCPSLLCGRPRLLRPPVTLMSTSAE